MNQAELLLYSSHNRCNHIHNDWIVQRALEGNKKIMYLPMSQHPAGPDEYRRQVSTWQDFEWFFNYYKQHGLQAFAFYWNSGLRREDLDCFFTELENCEVVILGGGNPGLGMARYKSLGYLYCEDEDFFTSVLYRRCNTGLLTVGYSAGVDQLCQIMSSSAEEYLPDPSGFGLARNIAALSHYYQGREPALKSLAAHYGSIMAFGLPNDSGLAIQQFMIHPEIMCQTIRIIIDNSWDREYDQHHIKTRQGEKVHHFYPDGRHWAFSGGDVIVRFQSMDQNYNEAFIFSWGCPARDYWTQEPLGTASIETVIEQVGKRFGHTADR